MILSLMKISSSTRIRCFVVVACISNPARFFVPVAVPLLLGIEMSSI